MPRKGSKKEKPKDGSYIVFLKKEAVEEAMKRFEEDMMKDPEGKRMLEEIERALEKAKAMKEAE